MKKHSFFWFLLRRDITIHVSKNVKYLRKFRRHMIGVRGSIRIRDKEMLFCETSSPALGLVESPVQWVSEDLSFGTKRSARETHHSPPYALIQRKRKLDLYLP
jgi:hypothetical protein